MGLYVFLAVMVVPDACALQIVCRLWSYNDCKWQLIMVGDFHFVSHRRFVKTEGIAIEFRAL